MKKQRNCFKESKETEELSFRTAPSKAVCSWTEDVISTFLSSINLNQDINLDLKLILDKCVSIRIAPFW